MMLKTEAKWTSQGAGCHTFLVLKTGEGYVSVLGMGWVHFLEGRWVFAVVTYLPSGMPFFDGGEAFSWEQVDEETVGAIMAAHR